MLKGNPFCVIAISWMIAASAHLARAEDPAIHVSGAIAKSSDWTAAQIHETFGLEIKTIEYSSKDKKHSSQCVALLSILKAAGVDASVGKNPSPIRR